MRSRDAQIAKRSRSSFLGSVLLLLSTSTPSVTAQVIGQDIFICSPTAFTFTLDFSGDCPGTVEEGPGIEGLDCFFLRNSTIDPRPASVKTIQILELDLDLNTIFVDNFVGNFQDGDSVEYSSVSAGDITDDSQVPGGIQLNIVGTDANGLQITNSFIVEYTNDGAVSPILFVGDQIGWVVFVSIRRVK